MQSFCRSRFGLKGERLVESSCRSLALLPFNINRAHGRGANENHSKALSGSVTYPKRSEEYKSRFQTALNELNFGQRCHKLAQLGKERPKQRGSSKCHPTSLSSGMLFEYLS